MDPVFLSREQVLVYHAEQIALFNGPLGLRDEGLLDSALVSPQNLYLYDDKADIFDLAAAYLRAISKNHPFIDGNKRTATHAALAFLKINGLTAAADPPHLTLVVESLVANSCDELFVAEFLFLACCKDCEEFFEIPILESPPLSYRQAHTSGEKAAIITDYVTSAYRIQFIKVCETYSIRSDRFTLILDRIEEALFSKVEEKWRRQFGMPGD